MSRRNASRPERIANTIRYLRTCRDARASGMLVSFSTDPSWLVNQAINRRAGWMEAPSLSRGTARPNHRGQFPRRAGGDYHRHLALIAREINTPRLIVREEQLGEHRWLADQMPGRIERRPPRGRLAR